MKKDTTEFGKILVFLLTLPIRTAARYLVKLGGARGSSADPVLGIVVVCFDLFGDLIQRLAFVLTPLNSWP